jgi:CRISPR-associated endoribonuclease Cas6
MRFLLHFTLPNGVIPFDHLHRQIGTLHKWIGMNDLHDHLSLYSFGKLQGGKATEDKKGLVFPNGARMNLSFWDAEYGRKIIEGILLDPEAFFGMRIYEVREVPTPHFSGTYCFRPDSPILARKPREDGSVECVLFENPEADVLLTQTLRHKLQVAGFEGAHLETRVQFDRTFSKARHRLHYITAHGQRIGHKASECPVWVIGTEEAVRFAWHVGLGHLTGSGFGALM